MGYSFDRLQAAAIDGRAHNVFYRQQQIESLCGTLLENTDKIHEAITSDTGNTLSEVTVEFNLALAAVRADYASLQPTKAREEEYAIANGKNAAQAKVPVGVVYIEPATHTLFYSTIVPLSAAIAAGNCVILQLENNLRSTSNLLRQLLSVALSAHTFAIASDAVIDEELLRNALVVKQNCSGVRWPRTNELISLPHARAIAIVDRTADVQLAAKEVTAARFSFGGTSPYAPDVILVNEFVKKDFLQAVVSECVSRGSESQTDDTQNSPNIRDRVNKRVETLKTSNCDLHVVVQQSRFAVVDLPSRLEKLPEEKNADPILIVSPMTSLDDAIDLAGRSSSDPYVAAYHFSNLRSAKYLSQFIDARVAFVNHIPRELLVGPTCPIERPFDLSERYPISVFELERPVLVSSSAQSKLLNMALELSTNSTAQQLWQTGTLPLKAMKRVKGGGVGFFEQGFLMNAALILTSTLALSSTGAWYLWKYARHA